MEMEKQTFLFVFCDVQAQTLVRQLLTETCFKNCSERTIGPTSVFLVKGNENAITRLGCSLISLSNSLPAKIEIFDQNGAI